MTIESYHSTKQPKRQKDQATVENKDEEKKEPRHQTKRRAKRETS